MCFNSCVDECVCVCTSAFVCVCLFFLHSGDTRPCVTLPPACHSSPVDSLVCHQSRSSQRLTAKGDVLSPNARGRSLRERKQSGAAFGGDRFDRLRG